ncbi:MAG: hypothetical protein PW792_17765 [Acidobacteriaceae bacterium]|nr:hypothetical protein [Acidobacteriaceae bacterium]
MHPRPDALDASPVECCCNNVISEDLKIPSDANMAKYVDKSKIPSDANMAFYRAHKDEIVEMMKKSDD